MDAQLSKRAKKFLLIYTISIFCLFMSLVNNAPVPWLLGKVKWGYIVFCIADCLLSKKKGNSNTLRTITLGLCAYIFLFGILFRNEIVSQEINDHAIMMTIYVAMLYLTCYEVNKYCCLDQFVTCSWWAIALFIYFCGLTHLNQIVWNPIYMLVMFLTDARVGSEFGFTTSNYIPNFIFVLYVLSVLQITDKKKRMTKHFFVFFVITNVFAYLIMSSASSRSPSLTTIFFLVVCFWTHQTMEGKKNRRKTTLTLLGGTLALAALGVFTAIGGWQYLWQHSNRSLNITANLPWVEILGSKWMGMGFVENAAFQTGYANNWISSFGVRTSSLDMNYVYWYCTTGVVGCLIMGYLTIYLFMKVYKRRRAPQGGVYFALMISIPFYGFWETIIFSYRFWGMLIIFCVLICFASRKENFGKSEDMT